jgi:hypothetical protein
MLDQPTRLLRKQIEKGDRHVDGGGGFLHLNIGEWKAGSGQSSAACVILSGM